MNSSQFINQTFVNNDSNINSFNHQESAMSNINMNMNVNSNRNINMNINTDGNSNSDSIIINGFNAKTCKIESSLSKLSDFNQNVFKQKIIYLNHEQEKQYKPTWSLSMDIFKNNSNSSTSSLSEEDFNRANYSNSNNYSNGNNYNNNCFNITRNNATNNGQNTCTSSALSIENLI